jgi:hypothetical protein
MTLWKLLIAAAILGLGANAAAACGYKAAQIAQTPLPTQEATVTSTETVVQPAAEVETAATTETTVVKPKAN